MQKIIQQITENAIISIGAAFVAGAMTTSIAALFTGAILPLWRMYPKAFRDENVVWLLVGIVAAVVVGWLYASQKKLYPLISISSWLLLLVGLLMFAINQDNRNFFGTPEVEYGAFCALIMLSCILTVKTAIVGTKSMLSKTTSP